MPILQGIGQNDAVDFDTTWATLASSLREIHTKNASKLSFEALYRNAYKLVLKKLGEQLYFRVKEFEQTWLTTEVLPRVLDELSPTLLVGSAGVSSVTTANEKRAAGEKMLMALKRAWEDHNLCMNMTSDILMYMVRRICVLGSQDVQAIVAYEYRSASTVQTIGSPLFSPLPWLSFAILSSEPACPPRQTQRS